MLEVPREDEGIGWPRTYFALGTLFGLAGAASVGHLLHGDVVGMLIGAAMAGAVYYVASHARHPLFSRRHRR